MATMKPVQKRLYFGWFAVGLIGVLLGVLVVVGIDALQSPSPSSDTAAVSVQTNHDLAFSGPGLRDQQVAERQTTTNLERVNGGPGMRDQQAPVQQAQPRQTDEVYGGRMGGITSADTANDAAIRQGLAAVAPSDELTWSQEQAFLREQTATPSSLLPDLDETTHYRHQTPASSPAPSDELTWSQEQAFLGEQWKGLVTPPYQRFVNAPQ